MAETSIPSIGDLHDDQLVALLRSGAHAALLTAYFGESEYRELAQLAKLAVTRRNPRGRRVFVLPGIMGSRLGLVARRKYSLLWLHPTAVANGSLLQLAMPSPRALRAVGVMLPGYLKLRLRLEVAGFRPVFCPFDWRRDVDHLAREFARLIERSGERKALVVGHSMGGVIARAALAYDKRRIAKLIQLGAPNEGSFAPLQALRAVYPTVRKIASLDRDHSAEHLARTVFHTLPGIYQMLPSAGNAAEPDLFDPRGWPADELAPNPKLLARARWTDAATWYVNENHGALTKNDLVLAAVAEILKTGDTRRLRTTAPKAAEGASRIVTEEALRACAVRKVQWDTLSLDSRRRILDPVLSPEFLVPAG